MAVETCECNDKNEFMFEFATALIVSKSASLSSPILNSTFPLD